MGIKQNKIVNEIDGVIILDKPRGYTSNDCLSIIKKYLHPAKIGHTGTLDENATGVLVCLLGKATKCQDYLMRSGNKVYVTELILGVATDTEDITGNIIEKYDGDLNKITKKMIKETVESFVGDYEQIPPMYSAKKVDGKKLLNLARKGVEIERKPCNIKIDDIKVLKNDANIILTIRVVCSKGTYIRTLCKDIGKKLGVPSCMGQLRRYQTGYFDLDEAITLEEIKKRALKHDFTFVKPCLFQNSDSVVTFGKFSTIHLGHQEIIKKVVDNAKENNLKSTILTIGNTIDSDIITKEQWISKIKYLGIDNVLSFPFNEVTKKMTPFQFVKGILVDQLKAKIVIVGSDCSFGNNGIGNYKLLDEICSWYGVNVIVVDKLKVENTNVDISSTLIKEEFKKGNFALVNKLMGRVKNEEEQ